MASDACSSCEPHHALRRRRRARHTSTLHRRPRRDLRAHRTERRRQDDGLQRRSPACTEPTERRGPLRRASHRWAAEAAPRSPSLGIARTFQNIRLFPDMTALENVMVGADAHHRTSVPGRRHPVRAGTAREEADGHERAHASCSSSSASPTGPSEAARNLPYGDQRRLEIARALATEPKLLLLDEPAAGFNPAEKQELMDAHPADPRQRATRCCSSSTTWAWS